jgi:hypothetical protein
MSQTQYVRLTTAALNTLLSTTLGNLKPYQIRQVQEWLSRTYYVQGPQSDVGVESNMTTIVGTVSPNNA